MAGDQTDNAVGQPQSGLWFGAVDDLWRMGKPSGWGSVWRDTAVKAGEPSDPFLMTGFDKKVVHLTHTGTTPVIFSLEVDFLGDGTWREYDAGITVPPKGYAHYEFPGGFSAHWVRVKVNRDTTATAHFTYH
jgi:hypothetical protein